MKREHLEHILRAACAITQHNRFLIVGSQAILGVLPDPPGVLGLSMEVDLVVWEAPEMTDLVEGLLGELTPFHETFGYYAQAVGYETAVLPTGWQDRLIAIPSATSPAVGWALEPADLVVSKLVAAREKDGPFVAAVLAHGLAHPDVVRARILEVPAARLASYGLTASDVEARFERVASSLADPERGRGVPGY